jgi:hypothetical protein
MMELQLINLSLNDYTDNKFSISIMLTVDNIAINKLLTIDDIINHFSKLGIDVVASDDAFIGIDNNDYNYDDDCYNSIYLIFYINIKKWDLLNLLYDKRKEKELERKELAKKEREHKKKERERKKKEEANKEKKLLTDLIKKYGIPDGVGE